MNKIAISFIFFTLIFLTKAFDVCAAQKSQSIVFVILTHCRDEKDYRMFLHSHNSIKLIYPGARVIVIDDHSPYALNDTKIEIIKSDFPNAAGEILPYYYFLKYRWADKMIFLHDSMFLKRRFHHHELNHPVKFHWHFPHQEESPEEEIQYLLSYLKQADELIDYNLNQKSEWLGCFGVASLISLDVLRDLESKYGFISRLVRKINDREERMALERIFAILLFREGYLTKEGCSNFGTITEYPYNFRLTFESGELAWVKEAYPGAIIKTWRGR